MVKSIVEVNTKVSKGQQFEEVGYLFDNLVALETATRVM